MLSQPVICWLLRMDLAEWTGLEPATPGVTGRYSNQLNYRSNFLLGVEGFIPSTLARSRRSSRRAGPGRRQKGAEFSRESELCRFDDSSDFLSHESMCRGVPVRIDGRAVQRSQTGGKMAPEHGVTVDHVQPALRRELFEAVIRQGCALRTSLPLYGRLAGINGLAVRIEDQDYMAGIESCGRRQFFRKGRQKALILF